MKRVLLLLLPALVLLAPTPLRGQATGRAGVVVKFGGGSVQSSCVSFTGDSISGLELLQRSGLDVIAQTSGNNAAVCKIGPDGCNYPAESCLACKFNTGAEGGQYWAYWQLSDGGWRYSQQGTGLRRVRNGDVDGWAYGTGNVQTGAQPPPISFEDICPVAPAPQPVVEPTATPRPTTQPTALPTVWPTIQPTRASTARPTEQPTATAAPTSAIVASAPAPTAVPATATSLPPSATPSSAAAQQSTEAPPDALASATPTASASPAATQQSTAAPMVPDESTATPLAGGAAAPAPAENRGNYVVFAAMLLALMAALGLAMRRRAQ